MRYMRDVVLGLHMLLDSRGCVLYRLATGAYRTLGVCRGFHSRLCLQGGRAPLSRVLVVAGSLAVCNCVSKGFQGSKIQGKRVLRPVPCAAASGLVGDEDRHEEAGCSLCPAVQG